MKTYTFTMFMVNGSRVETTVAADNMCQAVSRFRNTNTVPYMNANVRVSTSTTTYPVTRERWGHAWDGKS